MDNNLANSSCNIIEDLQIFHLKYDTDLQYLQAKFYEAYQHLSLELMQIQVIYAALSY